ncbi:unnamed protein product [Brachionus calyciflorus]|uniref:Uncharacterized protein n=1 Tax=Brachionus calyciflorus TaxID=104777 RepID=A0A814DZ75_9BILA|nr:unnamed protein product [Brachionus calyciflorus]
MENLNNLEGFNRISNNIYNPVEALQKEVAARVKYYRAVQGHKADPREKLYVTKDGKFGSYKEFYLSEDIIGVAQQNISSSDEDENVSEESSDQDTDESLTQMMKMKTLYNHLNNL